MTFECGKFLSLFVLKGGNNFLVTYINTNAQYVLMCMSCEKFIEGVLEW